MNFKRISCGLIVVALLSFFTSAIANSEQTTFVVSPLRSSVDSKKLGTSVTVITADEIEARGESLVADVLRGVGGIDVVRSGVRGGNTSIFLRGANAEHTLVLIDGVEVNNPINPTRAFNFADLSVANIERIEIVKGPQSVAYGSDALGGIINIITKRGSGEASSFLSFEGGSYSTFTERAGSTGSSGIFGWSLEASREDSEGISSANVSDGNTESDSFENTSVAGKFSLTPNSRLEADLILRASNSKSDLDNFGGLFGDDPNRVLDNDMFLVRGELRGESIVDLLSHTAAISLVDQSFDDNNYTDDDHPLDSLISNYDGELFKLELTNNLQATDWMDVIFGVEHEEETGKSMLASTSAFGPYDSVFPEKSLNSEGYFAQLLMRPFEDLSILSGLRVDDTELFGDELTWKVAPSLNVGSSRLFASYGTAFKAPSLFQLYSDFGSPDLEPEESKGYDIGVEVAPMKGVTSKIVYFKSDFDNLISFNPETFVSENIGEAKTSGIEFLTKVNLNETSTLDISYTFNDAEDRSTGEELLRRPRNKARVGLSKQFCEKLKGRAGISYVGVRTDNDFSSFPSTRINLDSYTLVDFGASYALSEAVELFARLENAFDEEYEEVLGFGTLGAAAYGGVKIRL